MENLAGRRFSLTHPAAAATAATSPHFQLPPAVAFLFPSLLRNTAGPLEAADSGEMLLLPLSSGGNTPLHQPLRAPSYLAALRRER